MARRLRASIASFLMVTHAGRLLLVAATCAVICAWLRLLVQYMPSGAWQALIQFGGLCLVTCYVRFRRRNQLRTFMGTGEDLKRIYSQMPSAKYAPRPPIWAFDPVVQFVPWMIYNMISTALFPIPFEAVPVQVKGLTDKTQPEGPDNPRGMVDEVIVNYYPPTTGEELQLPLSAPAIFVEPGLTCDRQDVPGSSLMRLAASRGFRSVVIERRGHGQRLRAPRWNLFGDSEDLEQVFHTVQRRLPDAPLFYIGISSGAKLIIEAVGKFDRRRAQGDRAAPRFAGSCCVCPGYNLETCFVKFRWPLSKLCLQSTKDKFMGSNEAVLRSHNSEAYDRAMAAPDLQTFLSLAAPFAGYPDAKAYFANENPVLYVQDITTPTLVLNAEDDPMTVIENAFVPSPFHEGSPTFVSMIERSPCGMLLLPTSGSHCPFLDGTIFPYSVVQPHLGWLTLSNWGERCAIEFFESILMEQSRSE